MRVEEIGIHSGGIDKPYTELGEVSVKVEAATVFSQTPTIEDVNFKLQEKASSLGANAVLYLANRRLARMLPLCRALLLQALPQETPLLAKPSLWTCPRCHGLMHLVERMTAARLFFAEHVEEKYRLDSS